MPSVVIKPGARLRSSVSEVEVVIVRAGSGAESAALTCGGQPLLDIDSAPGSGGSGEEVLLGKRYVDEDSGIELLCTKGGAGPLALAGRDLTVKGAKTLPSSD